MKEMETVKVPNSLKVINQTRGTIDSHYDLSANELRYFVERRASLFDTVADAFTYGYGQGAKAEKARVKYSNRQQPKTRNEYRDAIASNAMAIKSDSALKNLYQISSMFLKYFEENDNLTEDEETHIHLIYKLAGIMPEEYQKYNMKTMHSLVSNHVQRRDRRAV